MTTRRLTTRLVALLVLFFSACQPADRQQAEPPAVDTAAIRSAVQGVNSGFVEAAKAGNYRKQASFYTGDAVVAPPMAPPVRGRDSIRALMERVNPAGSIFQVTESEIVPLGPDRAYFMGVITKTFTPEGADQKQTVESTTLALLRRTTDGWKYHREVINLNQPSPETRARTPRRTRAVAPSPSVTH